jgi:O-antigen ligase
LRQSRNIIMLLAGFILIFSAFGITRLYSYAALGGLLGSEEEDKYRNQVGALGVLLSGRNEILVSSQAIFDRPLFGHGSWAANSDYAYMLLELSGIESVDSTALSSDLIPSHSHLFGAWVEGGILSALFWLYVLKLLFRTLTVILRRADLINPMVAFSLINLGWAVFFSPYGLTNRALSCIGIVTTVTVLRLAARTADQDQPGARSKKVQTGVANDANRAA